MKSLKASMLNYLAHIGHRQAKPDMFQSTATVGITSSQVVVGLPFRAFGKHTPCRSPMTIGGKTHHE
jgi:hypothetical protein